MLEFSILSPPLLKPLKVFFLFFFFSMGIFAWCLSYLWAALTSFRICMCVQAWAWVFCFSAYSLSFHSSLAYLPLSLTEQLKALQWIWAANSDIWLQTERVSLLIILSQERERYTAPSMLWNFIACLGNCEYLVSFIITWNWWSFIWFRFYKCLN